MESPNNKRGWFERHKIWTALILLFIVFSFFAGQNASKTTTSSKNQSKAKVEKPKVATMGIPVRDGSFEFIVKDIKCGVTSVGTNPYLTKTPQGQFCVVSLSVENIGKQAQTFFSSNQKLLSSSNTQYSADDQATDYNANNAQTVFSNINPGNRVEGQVVFDVPKDVTPASAELHDSAYSGGAKVSLQ
jgi:hypothetical protein